MIIKKQQKLLFIGDSITDCGRAMPEGEGSIDSLGHGYVAFVEGLLQTVYPEQQIRVVNKGISGNTVRDLKARWQEDVLNQKPDWLSIMIGINDVWRQFDTPYLTERHVKHEEYEETLLQLVEQTKPYVKGIVLMTPFYIEQSTEDTMRSQMDDYGQIVKSIANKTDSIFVDTQVAFKPILQSLYSSAIARDRVHPTARGHMVLARAFLQSVGFDWNKK